MGNRMDDCADREEILIAHQKALKLIEVQAASYTISTIPVPLKIQLDEKLEEVALIKAQLIEAQLAKKENQQSSPSEITRQSPMR